MGRHIGYARVSSASQNLDLQLEALKDCQKIFTDKQSGKDNLRPGLKECLRYLEPGDTLEIWKLSRLGRSLFGLYEILNELQLRKVALKSHTEGIDTSTPIGRMIFGILGAIVQFQREIILENQMAGINTARAKGKTWGGRKRISLDKLKAIALFVAQGHSVKKSCKDYGVSLTAWYENRHRVQDILNEKLLGSQDNLDNPQN